jgi:hypothetical protein
MHNVRKENGVFSQKVVDLVDRLESIVKAFFEVKHIRGVSVETYHQDAPAVQASWVGPEDTLSRSIILLARESRDEHECYIDFEDNVWFDDTVVWERHWVREPAGTVTSTLCVESYTGEKLPVVMGILLERILNRTLKIQKVHLTKTPDLRQV